MLKRATYEQLPSVEANGPRGTHESHEVMAGILGAGQRARILATAAHCRVIRTTPGPEELLSDE